MNWTTKTGTSIPISKMTESHLRNTIKMLQRTRPDLVYLSSVVLGFWTADMSAENLRRMLTTVCEVFYEEQAERLYMSGFKMSGDIAQNQIDEGMDDILYGDEERSL